jgi:phosphatidylserine/phosphatidylglycerophosphate/cardiolipin synthase-like enzyme
MHKKAVFAIIILLFLTACTPNQAKITTAVKETNGSIEVYFCPRDNCSQQLISLINSANSSVQCAFYELELPEVIDALKNKNAEIITNIDRNSSSLMHNKFCIIDNKAVATGSFNPTENGDKYNNNNLVIIHSKYLGQNYKDEFNELKSGQFGKGNNARYPAIYLNSTKIENYFCPEDSCAEHIIAELKKAEHSIHFMAFTFTHNSISNALALKLHHNLTVKGLIEKSLQSKYSRYDFLELQGAEMHYDTNPKIMHHKVFIIDNQTVITGSMNPTFSADTDNDENIIIIHDKQIAEKFLKEFEGLI